MDVKVRRRAVVLALSVPGRLCRCTVSRTAQTVGCDTQWQGENYRDIATLQRSAAFKTLASPLLEGHERAQQPSPPDIVWALSTAAFAARCLHVVSDLGVADRIGDQPVRIGELASSCGVDPDGLAIEVGQPDRVQALVLTGKPAAEVLEHKGASAYLQDRPDEAESSHEQ